MLEKPASSLDPRARLVYLDTHNLRIAAGQVVAPAQIATNDHYNAKLITRAMDRIRDYHLFDHVLDPTRINRIVMQLLEPAPLPLGRCNYYNGAGGAFGDMVPHLLQAVRAILGLPTISRNVSFDEFHWARYDGAPLAETFAPSTGPPYTYEPDYYQPLHPDTETFVAFKATVNVSGRSLPLYCRTGKGFRLPRKTLRVDVEYIPGSQLSLSLDFGSASITIRDDSKDFVLATGRLDLREPFQSGVPGVESEYRGIFECLVNSDWKPNALDARYFPSVDDAAYLADLVFNRLISERRGRSTMSTYTICDSASYSEVLNLLDPEARWN